MGGSSDAPNAPNYKPQIKAAMESANWSSDNAKDMLQWAIEAYEKNGVVSDEVINNALGWMDTMTDWSEADRQRYQDVFQPVEDALVKEAMSYSTPERLELEAGKAEADVAQQFNAARQAAQDRLEAYGVDPSQTRQGALDLGTRVAEGAAQASAGNQARWNAEEVGRGLRDKAIALGSQYPGRALSEAQAAGNFGTTAVNTGLAQTASGAQTMGTAPQWTQIGQQGIGLAGNLKNQSFQNELGQFQAEQSASDPLGELVGTFAGRIPLPFAGGGAIPDEMSPSGGEVTDDVPAQIEGGPPAKLNAGEFVLPKDVTSWLGEKELQKLVLKSRKEMTGSNGERPAQPSMSPAPPSYDGAGAIPDHP